MGATVAASELSSNINASGDEFTFVRSMNYSSLSREDLKEFMDNIYVYNEAVYVFDRVDFEIDYEGDYCYDGRDEFYDPKAITIIEATFRFVKAI